MIRFLRSSRVLAGLILSTACAIAGAQTATVNILHSFNGTTDGGTPLAPVIQASDGNFYGITSNYGTNQTGTVFKYIPQTSDTAGTYKVIHAFAATSDGSVEMSRAGLTEGADGNVYGVTSGNDSVAGVFFQINVAKGTYKVLHTFGNESYAPATLTLGSDGNFYTTTEEGGDDVNGTILRITPAGVVTDLYEFPGGTVGSNPSASLVETAPLTFYSGNQGDDGLIFEAVVSGDSATVTAPAGFSGTNGANPDVPFIEYSDGTLYSATLQGGSGANGGVGTIFKYNPSTAAITSLYDLNTSPATNGDYPNALVLGSDGNFYFPSETSVSDCLASINKITPAGVLTTVYDGNTDANRTADSVHCPSAGLVQGADGTYYGTSSGGTANGAGDIFQMVPATLQKAPVQLTANTTAPVTGSEFTLSYTVTNGFSLSAQQCYAFVQGGAAGAGVWTGKQTGKQGTSGWKGSAAITPTTAGTYTYALTCAGTESGFITLTVGQGTVTKASSSISITSINSPNYGGALTIAVQVDSSANSGTPPTGTVTFVAGTSTLGTVTLVPGSGTLSTATLSIKDPLSRGTYALKITYNGDTNYNTSTLGGNLTIAAISSSVSINSVSTVQYNGITSVNLTAGSASGSGPVPTGTVTVTIGSMAAATYALTGGSGDSVTVNIGIQTTLAPGTYPVGVTYNGDNTYSTSSGGANLTITGATTTTALFGPVYARVGDALTLYYQVKSASGVPAGTVQLYFDGGTTFGSPVTLAPSSVYADTAVATFVAPGSLTATAPASSTVPYGLTAKYTPASGSAYGSSGSLTHNLYLDSNADAKLSFTIGPAKINYKGFITLQTEATGAGTFSGGTFLYTFNSDVLGSDTVNSVGSGNDGLALPLGTTPSGTYTLKSTYTGDAKNSAAAATAAFTIEALFGTATTGSDSSGNQTVTLTAYAAPSPGTATYPTGTVNFAIVSPSTGSGPGTTFVKFSLPLNSAGVATPGPYPTAGFPAGTYTVNLTYGGDAHTGASSYSFPVAIQ